MYDFKLLTRVNYSDRKRITTFLSEHLCELGHDASEHHIVGPAVCELASADGLGDEPCKSASLDSDQEQGHEVASAGPDAIHVED